jgi:cytochrome d ubiquinol oxidase subunit I
VVTSLVTFTLLYAALAGVWVYLMRRYVVAGPLEIDEHPHHDSDETDSDGADPDRLSFAY